MREGYLKTTKFRYVKVYHVLTFFSALFGQRRHVVVIAKIKSTPWNDCKNIHTPQRAHRHHLLMQLLLAQFSIVVVVVATRLLSGA